jgi:hypothetical protein
VGRRSRIKRRIKQYNVQQSILENTPVSNTELIKQAICRMPNHIFLFPSDLTWIYGLQHRSGKQNYICTHGKAIFYSDHLDAWVKNTLARIKFKRYESI